MRRQHDQYFTPEFATHELLQRVAIGEYVLECCNGDGAITRVLRSVPQKCVHTNDIDIALDADFHLDATEPKSWGQFTAGAHWVVSNPPFNQAASIIPLALEYATVGVAMLLRKSYTEPCFDRQDWLLAHRKNFAHQIFLPRISFTGDGKSDNVACDWHVWTKKEVAGCQVDWVMKQRRGDAAIGEWNNE